MSILNIFNPKVTAPIEAIGGIIDDLFTSDEEKISLDLARQRLNSRASEIQAEINKIEASHRSLFVAGWRPFLGWVCGASICYVYVAHPLLAWVTSYYLPEASIPALQIDHLIELVIAMLGLGGLRTFEKVRGRAK